MTELTDVRAKLVKLTGQTLFLELAGKAFKPKGMLKEVGENYIVVGEETFLITQIVSFKLANGGGNP